jgi:protein-S-isoprenylcysteine O-methyltransferase Ste14
MPTEISISTGTDWRERYRVRIGFIIGLIFLWRAQPRSVVLLALGLLIGLLGVLIRQWAAGCVKKNDELASSGPYGLVRHPLYFGSLLAAAGLILASSSFAPGLKYPYLDRTLFFWACLWILADSVYLPKVLKEERLLREKFPGQYEEFERRVPRIWPGQVTWSSLDFSTFSWQQWKKNKEYGSLVGYAVLALVLIARFLYRY